MDEQMKIKTSLAEPGMVIAKDIYSTSGHLIVSSGTKLTDRMITRLKFYSVDQLIIVTPAYLRDKTPVVQEKPTNAPVSSYVGRIKTTAEFRKFAKNFFASFVSYKAQINDVVHNKAPLNAENLLADIAKIFASCENPNSLLDMMMCIRELDDATYVHNVNVALICNLFAIWLKMDEKETKNLTLAGLLHDIGKMKIPEEILTKPGKLTPEEFNIMKEHPVIGYEILKEQKTNYHVCLAALQHHERCDGQGYPLKLTGDKIDKYAKIVAIADVFDALTAARVYRGPVSPLEVIGVFQTEGLTQYDTKYLMIFLDRIMCAYLHYTVRLSNGETGKIVMMHRNNLSRPMIALSGDRFIDLTDERDITIVGIV